MRVVAADPAHIGEAAERLRSGGLVAFPTETVYGLGGDATNAHAVAAIFALKARPSFNPLIVHVADLAEAERHGTFDARARRLAEALWPGPLSLVVERRKSSRICELACAGGPTVAIRVPGFPVARELLAATGLPVAAPSANPSGYLSPTTAQHVADGFGDADLLVLDGGPSPVGLESTVIDVSGPGPAVLLRAGGMPLAEIERLAGDVTDGTAPDQEKPQSPGLLARHYAPRLPLRLGARHVEKDEALLAFGAPVPAGAKATRNLSPSGDLVEAAANLFAMLHELERADATRIAVMPIPDEGLGRAINDRLRRGAEGSACASPEPA
jgi:L-threonylcarbamoyladenylate synthase